jgi:hypothetical protein
MQTDTRSVRDRAILWPSPGYPALLESHDRYLDVIVASRNPQPEALQGWARDISLYDRRGKSSIPLSPEEITQAQPKEIADRVSQFSTLPQAIGLSFVRARFRVPLFPLPSSRTLQLFDLSVGGTVERARSVAFFRGPGNALNIAFASDLHVAHLWNEIAAAARRYAPEVAGILADPHRLLDAFIDRANSLAANGDLDLVVLGGDLVDHVHRYPREDGRDNAFSNVHLLLSMIDRLEVPTLMVPGNHDYRSYPRRPRSSGLDVIGLSRQQSGSWLRKAGLWDCWPLSLRDLDALRTRDAAGIPALSDHLIHSAPAIDYSVVLRGLRLLLISSGCDILARWRDVERERLGLLVRGLSTALHCPDSEGFSDLQLAQIENWLADRRGAALFFHAPLLMSRRGMDIRQPIDLLDVGPQDTLRRRVRFEKRMQDSGLRYGVSFRNSGALIEKLAAASGPVAAFSGHVHYSSAVEIDRNTMRARSIDPDQALTGSGNMALLTAPAIGQLNPRMAQPPGYLLARFVDGALVSLQRRTLNAPH